MALDLGNNFDLAVNIKVIGVGGGGCNAVNRMIRDNVGGVEFVAVNTDKPVLMLNSASTKVSIGAKSAGGKGAGCNPEIGAAAAEESLDEINAALDGADMVFITAGMGGGTGTGAAPIIARCAKEKDILTIGIVTKPFAFEGRRKLMQAEAGIEELAKYVDSLIVIPNERLKQISDTKITLANAFEMADDVLRHGVQSISELINVPGLINLDFADVSKIMKDAGRAHMGVGSAKGKDKAEMAAKLAISSPLLETSISGAKGILINMIASPDIGLDDVDTAANLIVEQADPDALIIWGAAFDNELEDEMRVTVVAAGFDEDIPSDIGNANKMNTQSSGIYGQKSRMNGQGFGQNGRNNKDFFSQQAGRAEQGIDNRGAQPNQVPVKDQPAEALADGVLSEQEFDDLLAMLRSKKQQNQQAEPNSNANSNNNQGGTYGNFGGYGNYGY